MPTPPEIINIVADAMDASNSIPNSVTYLRQRADFSGGDAKITIPVVQLRPVAVTELNAFNTDRVRFKTDSEGNQVGEVYHAEYTMTIQIDVMTIEGRSAPGEDIESLIPSIRSTLYQYDSAGPSRELDDSIWKFQLGTSQRQDDLQTTPTVRKWRQDVDCWSYEVFETDEEFIEAFDFTDPNDSDVVK